MAPLNAALVEQFLNVPVATKRPHAGSDQASSSALLWSRRPMMGVRSAQDGRCSGQEAQRKAVVEPDGVLDHDHRETVAVGLDVRHGGSAYPEPDKATQPRRQQSNASASNG